MTRKNRRNGFVVGCIGCVLMALVGVGEAQNRVLPTGTPTITPRRPAATPTPLPPSPTEIEAGELGQALSQIDSATWDIVRTSWRYESLCLEAVDAHLGENLGELKRLIRTSKVMECAEDPQTQRRRLRLTSEEARRAFVLSYGDAAADLRSLREELADNLDGTRVLEAAQQRQADWQDMACREVDESRVPRAQKMPVKAPDRSSAAGGSS